MEIGLNEKKCVTKIEGRAGKVKIKQRYTMGSKYC